MGRRSVFVSLTFLVGGLAIFIGQRLLESGTGQIAWTSAGALLALAAAAWRAVRARGLKGGRRNAERWLLGLTAIGIGGLLLYFVQSSLLARLLGQSPAAAMPRLWSVLAALWPAVMAASLLPLLFAELAYSSMERAPQIETGRVRDAALSGLGLAFALVFCFSAMYVAGEVGPKWDLSYFRPAKAGSATKRLVAGLDEPLEVYLFYPPGSDTSQAVEAYFSELKAESPRLAVTRLDPALEPAKARELGAADGSIVIKRKDRKETLSVPSALERARAGLASLDEDVHKRLLAIARAKGAVYFTTGHGELRDSAQDGRAGTSILRQLLEGQGLQVRTLSASEGLGGQIPADASALFILGPQQPFQDSEVAALKSYLAGKGRLFLALDPEPDAKLQPLLDDLGVTVAGPALANDVVYARKSHQPSDRAIIGTATYSSHPAVSAVGLEGSAMFFLVAGTVTPKAGAKGLAADTCVRSRAETWNDANGNYQFDPPSEERRSRGLVVAVRRAGGKPEDEMRAIVASDSGFLSDEVLPLVRGNTLFAVDAARWLTGEESLVGATVHSEKDVPIVRTRKQDLVFFYGTTALAPALVLGAGLAATRRRRRRPAAQPAKEEQP
jgi:hypothetical protein